MRKRIKITTALFLTICSITLCSAYTNEEASPSQQYHDAIEQHVQNGQYNLAKDVAKQWAGEPDIDRKLMAKACAMLSNKKLHAAAVVLLEKLDWIMPGKCYWPDDTLKYMKNKGMGGKIDKILTHGTALVAKEDNRSQPPKPNFPMGYQTEVLPRKASQLFRFYNNDPEKKKLLLSRYENELAKRPDDVRLTTEYAYWLPFYRKVDRALEVIGTIDLNKLDLLTLFTLGKMWDSPNDDIRLVKYSIMPLERALGMEMTDAEASQYTSGWQIGVTTAEAKQYFREHLLTELAGRYAFVERYQDAKKMYEAYLALPRHKRWGDRTHIQLKYAEVLKKLGESDKKAEELKLKAKSTGNGKDWAELASYLQGQNEVEAAINAWEKAIATTPATPRGFKVERVKENYRSSLARLLHKNRMYEHEIRVLKASLKEEAAPYGRVKFLEGIAKAYIESGKKDQAITFMLAQLDTQFDLRMVHLIIQTDYGKSPYAYDPKSKKIPSWDDVVEKVNKLKEPDRSDAMAELYRRYGLYAEYMDLVEAFPEERIDFHRMDSLMDASHRCKRYERTVYWGKKILEHSATKGKPEKGSRDYIWTLEDISDYSAKAGDYETSLEYAKKLCLLVPDRFYFAKSLAEVADNQRKRDDLTNQLRSFAKEHPNRWVIWKVLAEVYQTFGDQTSRKECLDMVDRLR